MRVGKKAVLERLERNASKIVGEGWQAKINQGLLGHTNANRYGNNSNSYDNSVRDLLRLVRNQVRVQPQLISPKPLSFLSLTSPGSDTPFVFVYLEAPLWYHARGCPE